MKTFLGRKPAHLVSALVIAAAACITVTGIGAQSAQARDQKVTLTRTNRDCNGDIVPPSLPTPFGFAIIHPTGSSKLIANVVLQGGTANATYNIRLIQTQNGAAIVPECTEIDATLTTDAAGNGSTNVQEALLSGANDAFVVLNNQANLFDFFTTEEVFF
ncbi:hypothetical protein WMF39_22840 [Sorangium sp. So ce1504]|uniref:hypothetical protein n=1 Tax=Sorangium sp. So ce1504 TaxID=3133337 RepID=UPI003F615A6E